MSELTLRQRARWSPFPGQAGGHPLDGGVERGRHAVQTAEQDDLAVEVPGLDGSGAASQALPRRAPAPAPSLDRPHAEDVAATLAVLLLGGEVDAGIHQYGFAFGAHVLVEVAVTSDLAARRVDGVAQVHQKLAVLPSHDVRPRQRYEG